jgi:hypothetical protein
MKRLIPFVCFLSAVTFAGFGCVISSDDTHIIATFFSQTGQINPVLLEKVRLLPWFCYLTSLELFLTIPLFRVGGNRPANWSVWIWTRRSTMEKIRVGLLIFFGFIAWSTVNFYLVTLVVRAFSPPIMVGEKPLRLPDSFAPLSKEIMTRTDSTARILIVTARDEKYLINYDFYPRKFYIFPVRNAPASSIPGGWMKKNRIDWILEISSGEPMQYCLKKVCP